MTEVPTENRDEAAALIGRARAGDTEAFAVLCERYRRRVWRVVASVTRGGSGSAGGSADTEDLAQEAIVRAFRSLSSFRGEASFEAWLCRIALNAAHDYQKSAWRRRVRFWGQANSSSSSAFSRNEENASAESAVCAPDSDPYREAERRERQRRVRAAVAALGPKERVPLFLIYFEEFTLAEVARLEGIPESTVRSRVKVGLKRLERTLSDLRLPDNDADWGEGTGEAVEAPSARPAPPPQASAAVSGALFVGSSRPVWKGFMQ